MAGRVGSRALLVLLAILLTTSPGSQLAMLHVNVPDGVAEGDQFQANTPQGPLLVTVPPGVKPGDAIQIGGPVTPMTMDNVRGTWTGTFSIATSVSVTELVVRDTTATSVTSSKCYCCPCFPCCCCTSTMNFDIDPSGTSFQGRAPDMCWCCTSPCSDVKGQRWQGTLVPGTNDLTRCKMTGARPAACIDAVFWCMEYIAESGTLVVDTRAKTMTMNINTMPPTIVGGIGDGCPAKGGQPMTFVLQKQTVVA